MRTIALLISAVIAATPALAQQPAPEAAPQAAAALPTLTQQELDQVLAPIALYPDALLAQILMASTYPLEVVHASRWVKAFRTSRATQRSRRPKTKPGTSA